MVMGAIEELNAKEGSSKEAIANYIESNYADLPPTHATLVTHTLEKLKQTGQLIMSLNDTYFINQPPTTLPDVHDPTHNGLSSPPIKRGRGRPPKPKVPLPPGVVQQSPRPRGRPPKPRDPLAPASRPIKPPSSGRPRGRPPKKSTQEGGPAGNTVVVGGVKRGRGRPRKT